MSRTKKEIVIEALLHLSYVEKYAQENLDDSVYLDAISMRLSGALDSLNKLPQNTKENLFGKNWHYMRGMRKRIAHGYAVVDPATIRATVIEELPNLIRILKKQRTEEV